MEAHKAKVSKITQGVKHFYDRGEKWRIYHGSTNSTRAPNTEAANTVDTSGLKNILNVDTDRKLAVVEANVSMDALLEETLKHGLVPQVVTEFPGITVGGAYSGTAAESSSFKHGFFDCTVLEVEMVLASGEVTTCSNAQNADLFHGATGALGTLGVVTLLKIQLQEAAKYVEVTYHPVTSVREAAEKLRNLALRSTRDIQYIDGMMFSPTRGAVITGSFSDTLVLGLDVQRFGRAKDPWYYMHVEQCISSQPGSWTELVPLPDYIFRYNRGCFWCGATVFNIPFLPFNSWTRWLLDDLLRTRMLYKALHAQHPSTLMVIQDLVLPFSAAEDFVNWTGDRLGIWPLWLCPIRTQAMPTLHPHGLQTSDANDGKSKLMLNVGVYGVSPRDYEEWISANRDLEDKVTALGGMKWAYAAQLYPESKFWEQHDRDWYDDLREKYHARNLPTIFDKTRVDVEAGRKAISDALEKRVNGWASSFDGLVGPLSCIWDAIQSGAYKEERTSVWRNWPN